MKIREYIPIEDFGGLVIQTLEKTSSPNYQDVLEEAITMIDDNKVEYPSDLFRGLHAMMPRDKSHASVSWHNNVERLRKALYA